MPAFQGIVHKPQASTSSLESWKCGGSPCSFGILSCISPQSISLLAIDAFSVDFLLFHLYIRQPVKAIAVRYH